MTQSCKFYKTSFFNFFHYETDYRAHSTTRVALKIQFGQRVRATRATLSRRCANLRLRYSNLPSWCPDPLISTLRGFASDRVGSSNRTESRCNPSVNFAGAASKFESFEDSKSEVGHGENYWQAPDSNFLLYATTGCQLRRQVPFAPNTRSPHPAAASPLRRIQYILSVNAPQTT